MITPFFAFLVAFINSGFTVQELIGVQVIYLRGRGVFLNSRCMDNLFLNRMNSRQGIVKKEQETIFKKQ